MGLKLHRRSNYPAHSQCHWMGSVYIVGTILRDRILFR